MSALHRTAAALLWGLLCAPALPARDEPPPDPCTESVERGKALFKRGETEAALTAFEAAVTLAESSGLQHCLGEALYRIGVAHDHRGELALAAGPLDRAEALGRAQGDRLLLARVWNHRGLQARLLARFDEAERFLRQAVEAFRALGDKTAVSAALGNLGLVCQNRGDYVCGLDAQQRALEMDPRNSYALFNLAVIHEMQGEDGLSLDAYRRAAAIDGEDGDVVHEAVSLVGAGRAQARLGQAAAARASFAAARGMVDRGAGEVRGELEYALGELEQRASRPGEAVSHFSEAVRLQRDIPLQLSDSLQALSVAQLAAGRPAEALAAARRSLEIVDAGESWSIASGAWSAVGQAQEALGDVGQARAAYEQAVGLIESWRGHVAGEEPSRQSFFAQQLTPYHRLLALAVTRGDEEEALRRAEQARARVLVDVLQHGRQVGTRLLTPEERAREAEAEEAVRVLEIQREAAGQSGEAGRLGSRLEAARRTLAATRTALLNAHAELRLYRGQAEIVSLSGLSPLLSDGSAALAFTVAEHATYAFAYTATPEGRVSVSAATLPQGAAAWRTRVQAFRAALARRDLGAGEMAHVLFRDLLGPLQGALAGRKRLYLVPDGALWELPFAALQPRPRHFLVEDAALAVAPSLTALAAWRARPAPAPRAEGWAFLGIGATEFGTSHPALPLSARHTRAVAALYGPTAHVLLDRDATEQRAKAEMGRARVLHFATHGVVEPASPLYSALLLAREPAGGAENGRLEAREVLDLELPADLAVLSACETARGRIGAGEGVIGLSWAFSVAGVRNTVVSLWNVDAASTARLMLAFHRGAQKGLAYPEALRVAELGLLRQAQTRHPFYWAPFVLVGDGRRSDAR